MIEVLLLTHAAATLVMGDMIWSVQIVHRLVQSNWLRTAGWTGRGILVLVTLRAI